MGTGNCWIFTVGLLIGSMVVTVMAEDPPENLTITCPDYYNDQPCPSMKIINEYRLELVCQLAEGFVVQRFGWIHSNGSDVNELDSPRMSYTSTNTTATLVVDPILMEDSGNFSCQTSAPSLDTQTLVEVYIVPDYFVAGIILLSVNMGLFILFVACLIRSVLKQKADKKNLYKPSKSELETLSSKS